MIYVVFFLITIKKHPLQELRSSTGKCEEGRDDCIHIIYRTRGKQKRMSLYFYVFIVFIYSKIIIILHPYFDVSKFLLYEYQFLDFGTTPCTIIQNYIYLVPNGISLVYNIIILSSNGNVFRIG